MDRYRQARDIAAGKGRDGDINRPTSTIHGIDGAGMIRVIENLFLLFRFESDVVGARMHKFEFECAGEAFVKGVWCLET